MIRVTSIRKCHISDYDDVYLIVRSTASLERAKSSLLQTATHVPDLSPSKNLFYQYLNWTKDGSWGQATFDNIYRPTFIRELENNPNARLWLDKIKADDAAGKKIALLCFCADENLCHRIIVGEILRNEGCTVVFDSDKAK